MKPEELEAQISYYASKYYIGEPEITDEAFDALVDRLREINPNSPILKTGWGFEVFEDKVKHKYSHIGSLDKCKTYNDIPDIFKDTTIFISPKLDGLSAVAYYKNGQLVKGVTRGNGEVGKDITDKLVKILGTNISDKHFTGAVRGELIISNKNWEILNTKYNGLISPRNFSAGIINRKEIDEDIKYIDLVVYKIVGQENKPYYENREDILRWLNLNFEHAVPEYYYPVLNEPSWNMYHEETFKQFKELGYGLDGLVLTKQQVQYNMSTKGYTYSEVAYKGFKNESVIVTVTGIEWNLTRTQKLVPTVIFEECYLSGAKIQRATGFNAKFILENEIAVGSLIEVCRSGDVIPYILRRVDI